MMRFTKAFVWKGLIVIDVFAAFIEIFRYLDWTDITWWRHQMEIFSALLAVCTGNSLVTGEFPAQRPVTRGFDVFFDLRLNERLSKQSWGWWFETPSSPLWRHSNDFHELAACRCPMSFTKCFYRELELFNWKSKLNFHITHPNLR